MENMENLDRKLTFAVEKTDITSGTTLTTNGKLNAEQSAFMLKAIIDESEVLGMVTKQVMESPTAELNDFTVADRVITNPGEATAATEVTITTTKRSLTALEVVLACTPTYSFVEDNVSKSGGLDDVIKAYTIGFSNNISDLAWNGTGTGGTFTTLNKGWIQNIIDESNSDLVYDTSLSKAFYDTVFPATLAKLPSKYARNTNIKFIVSKADWELAAADLGSRNTPLGDSVLQGLSPLRYRGYDVIWLPYMPDNYHMLVDPKNLVFGVHRDIFFEQDRDIKKRYHIFVFSARIDFEVINPAACILAYDATP